MFTVSRDLYDAKELISQASEDLKEGNLSVAASGLDRAEGRVLRANGALRGSMVLDVAAWIPGVRQNLASMKDSVGVAATVIHGGIRILDDSAPLQSTQGRLEVSLSDGSIPLEAVTAAMQEIERLGAQLQSVTHDDEPALLLPPVRELRSAVYDEANDRHQQLTVLGRGLDLLHELAGAEGPRRYLLAVANTAEMRGSGGMILNYGVLEGRDGTIDLTDFGRVDELGPLAAVSADLVPADYAARWDGFEALSRFRQANLAGDFTVVAPVLGALYTSATQLPLNGVIQVDPAALSAILDGVGPVSIPELGQVTSGNVEAVTLNEAYFRFPDVESRSDVLGDVAEAAFRRLVDGDFPSLRPLAESLAGAVEGRHLLMWSSTSSSAQASVVAFGADGAYPPVDDADRDVFALTAQNLAGNKLDYYLDTDLQLTGTRGVDELGTVDARVTLINTAPLGSFDPPYIFGPGPGEPPLPGGVLRSVVTVYLPLGTSVTGVSGDDPVEPVSSGTEDGRPYASFILDVPASERRAVVLTLQLAPRGPEPYELTVVPSPRVRPTTVTVDLATEDGPVQGTVELDRSWVFTPGRQPAEVRAPIFR